MAARRRFLLPSPSEELRIEAALTEMGPEGVRTDPLAVAAALRERLPAHLARIAAERAELRSRAAHKLERAGELRLTRDGLEQATDRRVAAWRASRFAGLDGVVLDATAGLGGDAMQLAAVGVRVLALERDRLRAAHLAHNLALFGGAAVRADAARPPVSAYEGLVLDPDRRARGGRTLDPRRAEPGWDLVLELVRRAGSLACVKLAPGLEPGALAVAGLPAEPRRLAWVSLTRELKELGLWSGPRLDPADGPHEAIAIGHDGRWIRRAGRPRPPRPLERERLEGLPWIAVADPALVRAQLVGELAEEEDLAAITTDGGYLGGDERPASAWTVAFRVLDQAPLDRRRVRHMLGRHGIGPVTVKKRGISTSADDLARRLKGKGDRPGTLVVARHDAGHHVWLVERVG